MARPPVAESIHELVGRTPIVRLRPVEPDGGAAIYAKLENLNPGGSIKDRVAAGMIEAAEPAGLLRPGGTIVEPTAGYLSKHGFPAVETEAVAP